MSILESCFLCGKVDHRLSAELVSVYIKDSDELTGAAQHGAMQHRGTQILERLRAAQSKLKAGQYLAQSVHAADGEDASAATLHTACRAVHAAGLRPTRHLLEMLVERSLGECKVSGIVKDGLEPFLSLAGAEAVGAFTTQTISLTGMQKEGASELQ